MLLSTSLFSKTHFGVGEVGVVVVGVRVIEGDF